MAGAFTPAAHAREWCDRALLARIHRYTVKRLRAGDRARHARRTSCASCSAGSTSCPNERREGPGRARRGDQAAAGLRGAGRGVGIGAPAGASRRLRLDVARRSVPVRPRRVDAPDAAGRRGDAGMPGPIRTTPVTLLPRRAAAAVASRRARAAGAAVDARARARRRWSSICAQHGASFFDEIVEGTGLLRTQVEEALAELVALGVATSDSFAGLRALLTPSEKRKPFGGGAPAPPRAVRHRGRRALVAAASANRRPARRQRGDLRGGRGDRSSTIVHALLRRYGVVFWRMLQREAALAAAVARAAARAAPARGARRDPRRPLRRRRLRRAVRAARGRAGAARHAARAADRRVGRGQRRRSAESRRHAAAGHQDRPR